MVLLVRAPTTLIPTSEKIRENKVYMRYMIKKEESAPEILNKNVTERNVPINRDVAATLSITTSNTSLGLSTAKE